MVQSLIHIYITTQQLIFRNQLYIFRNLFGSFKKQYIISQYSSRTLSEFSFAQRNSSFRLLFSSLTRLSVLSIKGCVCLCINILKYNSFFRVYSGKILKFPPLFLYLSLIYLFAAAISMKSAGYSTLDLRREIMIFRSSIGARRASMIFLGVSQNSSINNTPL